MYGLRKRVRFLGKDPSNENPLSDGGDGNQEDRLSDLSDEILCHILSFLPTKNAVATSVLSTRWKDLFPSILDLKLHLDDTSFLHPERPPLNAQSFRVFIDKLFNVKLLEVRSIFSFSLICQRFGGGAHVANWVREVLDRNVKRLDLHLVCRSYSQRLLSSLFGCKLVFINLSLDFADCPELRFSFPNLKILTVQHTKFKLVNALLDGCPVLEYLLLYNCKYENHSRGLRICIPSLKGLKLVNYVNHLVRKIEIDCPNLEYLSYYGFLATFQRLRKMNSLRMALFDVHQNPRLSPQLSDKLGAELIIVCSAVQKLWLSEEIMMMLNRMPRPLPQFPNLVSLVVKNMDSYGWELLPSIIESAPGLKDVYLERGFDQGNYESFKASLKESWSVCVSPRDEKCFLVQMKREEDEKNSTVSMSVPAHDLFKLLKFEAEEIQCYVAASQFDVWQKEKRMNGSL